jgi:hypothetical protein
VNLVPQPALCTLHASASRPLRHLHEQRPRGWSASHPALGSQPVPVSGRTQQSRRTRSAAHPPYGHSRADRALPRSLGPRCTLYLNTIQFLIGKSRTLPSAVSGRSSRLVSHATSRRGNQDGAGARHRPAAPQSRAAGTGSRSLSLRPARWRHRPAAPRLRAAGTGSPPASQARLRSRTAAHRGHRCARRHG